MFKNLLNKTIAKDKISELWPKIEKLIIEKALPLVEDKLQDDSDLELLFNKSYELLPTGIRLITNRDKFLMFCMQKKDTVYILINDYRLKQCENKGPNLLTSINEDV
jgi:hypothetical protein